MNTKLTLSIDDAIVSSAKKHLQESDQSLSKLVEDYFRVLVQIRARSKPETTVLKEITGLAKGVESPDKLIGSYLSEKYE